MSRNRYPLSQITSISYKRRKNCHKKVCLKMQSLYIASFESYTFVYSFLNTCTCCDYNLPTLGPVFCPMLELDIPSQTKEQMSVLKTYTSIIYCLHTLIIMITHCRTAHIQSACHMIHRPLTIMHVSILLSINL